MMTEVVIKIMAELITVLALATKQMKRGRLGMFSLALVNRLHCGREIRKNTFRRDRISVK